MSLYKYCKCQYIYQNLPVNYTMIYNKYTNNKGKSYNKLTSIYSIICRNGRGMCTCSRGTACFTTKSACGIDADTLYVNTDC